MTTYIDKQGKEHMYHPEFEDEGDLVILSNDDKAFTVDSPMLKAASPVFRAMLDTCHPAADTDKNEDHVSLDHPADALFIFLKIEPKDLFRLFRVAAARDDHNLAHRVLIEGWRTDDPASLSVDPTSRHGLLKVGLAGLLMVYLGAGYGPFIRPSLKPREISEPM